MPRKGRAAFYGRFQVAEEALAAKLEQVSRETLARAARADIETYNAYIEDHGLFADMVRAHERDEGPSLTFFSVRIASFVTMPDAVALLRIIW